ncbi:uncharacterized protein DUF563 [Shimia isoporae]|uniref:Uncharacterized protein DUF563 n=1 Tax=Shimia isoporae TaxID=647720 RepID=A0A4R1NUM6_9RHOB|nr:glycosyltransferase 61 family protein [Shimia isoporae]TCL08958.1 uncharacterized protein DUF563 [Shimia isoporae]
MQQGLDNRRTVVLNYDRGIKFGSHEHYFHFSWGYLFPALSQILSRDHARETYVFEDCGPKMTPLIHEVGSALGLSILVVDADTMHGEVDIRVPRWDLLCLHKSWNALPEGIGRSFLAVQEFVKDNRPEHWNDLSAPELSGAFQHDVLMVRNWLLAHLEQSESVPWDSHLILRRSKELPFYAEDGGAAVKGYGETRRAIRNVDAAVETLGRKGLSVLPFDCGVHDLAGQAWAFRRCRGLAMVRGAEISNLIFARPGTRVFVITPDYMKATPPPHDGIVTLLGLKFHQVYWKNRFPPLAPNEVASFWREDG